MGTVFILLIGSWFILQSPGVQTFLVNKLAEQFSRKYNTSVTVKGVSISFFNKIILEDVLIKDQKNDSLLYVQELVASINSFSIKKRTAGIDKLELNNTFLTIVSDTTGTSNYQFLVDLFAKKDAPKTTDSLQFDFNMKRFEFNNASVKYTYQDSIGQHLIDLRNITLGVSDLELQYEKIAFLITQFQLNDHKDFYLEDFTARFIATSDSINLINLHALTSNSEITELNVMIEKKKRGTEFDLKKMKVNIDLKKSRINLKDMGMMLPFLKGMEENVDVSGQISGTLADLKGKNIQLSMGNNTQLAFDLYLNGLPEIANTYMHIDLKQSFADFNDLSKVKLPDNFPLQQLTIPAQLLQAGVVEYKGNFTGFLSDFVAFGTFRSKWGVLTTDLSFVPSDDEKLKINGKLKTVDFKLGELFRSDLLDGITFNGDIKGILNQKTRNFSARVSGKIDSVFVNNYQYKNIQLNGDVLNKKFDGYLLVDDPNLKLRFDGKFDLNVPVPVFNFEMLLAKADLRAMNLDHKFKQSEISFALSANFSGSNIDNIDGLIHFTKGTYRNENDSVSFDNFDLKTFYENGPVLQVRSDFLDADIRGQYEFHNLHHSVKKIIGKYLPSAGLTFPAEVIENNFDFKLSLKDVNRFTRVLMPDLMMDRATIDGTINSENNTLTINALFPEIRYQTAIFHKFSFNMNGNSKLDIHNKIEQVSLGEKFKVYNLSLISEAENNILDSKLIWNNFDAVSYSGSLNTSAKFFEQKNSPHVEVSVKPSRIYLADTLWQLNSALITVDSTLIKVNKLKLSNKGQSVTVDGSIDKSQENKLNFIFDQIDLNVLNNFVAGNLALKGNLNGSLSFLDVYERPLFLSDLEISGLSLLRHSLGTASVQSRLDRSAGEINAEVLLKSNDKNTLLAYGIYNPAKDSLSVNANFDQFSLLILQPLMGTSFSNFHGEATGKVHVYGKLNHIQHKGALYASNAGLMLSELQVNYTMNDSVKFEGDNIIFPQMRIYDDFGNSGIFSGSIQHRSFSKMVYDLSVRSDRIMAINTTSAINQQFYGKTFGSGNVRITGQGANVLITGVAQTERGTDMSIYLEYADEAQQYDFLTFVNPGNKSLEEKKKTPVIKSDLQMRFDIRITPEAKAQLIYNSKIGDVIRAQGSSDNMQIYIDNNSNITMYGEYTVEQGDYLFTLQNVINKKFEIQRGGTIQWNGDPTNAVVDLNAIYRLKASLSELFANTYDDIDSQRIPVLCKIELTRNLSNPDIKFDIELPSTEDRIKDEIKQYISSEEDMNKQMLSLLVLGRFYATGVNSNLAGSTASTAFELFSNQFSNWLSQISNDFDIGFNYRPGDQISNDEVELALSTQMFNNRVSINGNIANNSSQKLNANNNSLVGDADVNVKLTQNGKLQLKAYNHANNNLIYETSPYTQGVGLSYREDFNDFEELWQKVKTLFGLKRVRSVPVN
ncbi:MAG: translocation/assembly module TamB [Prolixibacteraceae bacterium]|nr:translocation/assembly module TamB [Prolixibacteraceae bacterium]